MDDWQKIKERAAKALGISVEHYEKWDREVTKELADILTEIWSLPVDVCDINAVSDACLEEYFDRLGTKAIRAVLLHRALAKERDSKWH